MTLWFISLRAVSARIRGGTVVGVAEAHKAEALRTFGLVVASDLELADRSELGKYHEQHVVVDLLVQVAHVQSEQLLAHLLRRHLCELIELVLG